MSERIALDYTNGAGEPIPCGTWTGIDPNVALEAAQLTIPAQDLHKAGQRPSLLRLATLVDLEPSDGLRELIRKRLGTLEPGFED